MISTPILGTLSPDLKARWAKMHIVGVPKTMQKAEFPCKGCTDRYAGCHDKCEKYRESLKKYRALDRDRDKTYVKRLNREAVEVATRYKDV